MADDKNQLLQQAFDSFVKQNGREPNAEELAAAASPAPKTDATNKRLAGSVSNDLAQKEAVSLFPQEGDMPLIAGLKAVTLPVKMATYGMAEVPEDLGNLALGAGESLFGVPQQNRFTIGDLGRLGGLNPGFRTVGEMMHSHPIQEEMQKHPALGALGSIGSFVGGLGAPAAAAQTAVSPALQNLAKVGVAKALLKFGLGHAGTGAAYATAFGSGAKFGQEKRFPNPGELAGMAGTGAAIGLAMPPIVNAGQKLMGAVDQNVIGPMFGRARPQPQPQPVIPFGGAAPTQGQAPVQGNAMMNIFGGGTAGGKSAKAVLAEKQAQIERIANLDNHTPENRQLFMQNVLRHTEKEYGGNPDYEEVVAQLKKFAAQKLSEIRKGVRQAAATKESRAHQQSQQHAKEQRQVARTTEHSAVSDQEFERLRARIASAEQEDLTALDNDIHASGYASSSGRPVLQSWQRSRLKSLLAKRAKELGQAPGESAGTEPGSPQVPAKATGPEAKGTETPNISSEHLQPSPNISGEQKPSPREQSPQSHKQSPQSHEQKPQSHEQKPLKGRVEHNEPVAKPTEIESFVQGTMRKTLSPQMYDPRNQYKLAISPEALGQLGGLEQHEVQALKKWTDDLHECQVEIRVKKAEIERLATWALEHPEKWQAKVGDISRDWANGGMTLQKEGEIRRMFLKRDMEKRLESKLRNQLSYVRSILLGKAAKKKGVTLRVNTNPSIATNVCGRADDTTPMFNGSLEAVGMKKIGVNDKPFVEPKDTKELYDRLSRLDDWVKFYEERKLQIKNAEAANEVHDDNFDYLGDGRKPVDVMEKVFNRRKDLWVQEGDPGKVPTARVWIADDFGYVSTVTFRQRSVTQKFNDKAADLAARYKAIKKAFKDKLGYEKGTVDPLTLWKDIGSLHVFTGLEAIPLLPALAAKNSHGFLKALSKSANVQALTVGTIDNILRGKVEWGGDAISDRLHNMLGTVLDAFFTDRAGMLHAVSGGEELTALLNEFTGIKLNMNGYMRHANMVLAPKEAKLAGRPAPTAEDFVTAQGKARTALGIRMQYKQLAAQIEPGLKEMAARAQDRKNGFVPPERMSNYMPHEVIDGKQTTDAYDEAFHEALKTLHSALTLRGKDQNMFDRYLGGIIGRKNASIFGNNFRTGFGNFFDAGVPTLLEFHKHFFKAAADIRSDAEIKAAVERLPIVPQADMNLIELQERMRNRPHTGNDFDKFFQGVENIQAAEATKMDPIFHGKERIVSMADRTYSRTAALASIYKQAERYGYSDGKQLVMDMISGNNISPQQRQAIFAQVSKDLTKVYNSVAPHLNRDLFASSITGKFLGGYSGPKRRTLRYYWDLARSDDPKDKLKFVAAMGAHIVLAGRGVIPMSVRGLLVAAGGGAAAWAGVNGNEYVEQGLQNLDKMNLLQRYTGLDLSNRMDFDIANQAAPAIEAWTSIQQKAGKAIKNKDAIGVADAIFGEALSVVPRISSFGYDVWKSGLKDAYATKEAGRYLGNPRPGEKTYWLNIDGQLKPVKIRGYDFVDALRDWAIPGTRPEVYNQQQRYRMRKAKKADVTSRRSRDIIPADSSATILNQS